MNYKILASKFDKSKMPSLHFSLFADINEKMNEIFFCFICKAKRNLKIISLAAIQLPKLS
jgi:hypothetical protein